LASIKLLVELKKRHTREDNPSSRERESAAALVTGGGVRVGRAICERIARDFERIAVHFNDSEEPAREVATNLEAAGVEARIFKADLSMPGSAARLAAETLEWSGGLDLLVNNAATFIPDDGKLTDLARMKAINYDSAASLLNECTEALAGSGGAIVNIADVAGFEAFKGFRAYSSTKRALLSLTMRKALELAPRGVRVNAVCPGAVMWPEWYDDDRKQRVLEGIPMGIEGSPGDIADAVAYLASAQFVTGQALCVDGGRMLVIDQS